MTAASPLDFLAALCWLDGQPLLDTIEPYRRRIFEAAFSVGEDGLPRYTLVVSGRGKKNAKSLDLVLAGLYVLLLRQSVQGSGGYVLANDLGQAGDDLDLAKKLVRVNPILERELEVRAREVERKDGRGALVILPARDVAGSHGKTAAFVGFDEIHEYRDYALLEALSPDPTRRDALTWIASYDSLWHVPGRPLWDLFLRGRAGDDQRMLFSWYSGAYTTDPDVPEDATPEQRANPSMTSWTNPRYLEEQRLRLPAHKYRRLHLNIGGQPEGAYLAAERVLASVVPNRRRLPPVEGVRYVGFVDMSGGSSDDACLAISHRTPEGRLVLDLVVNQGPPPPFDPRAAVRRFAPLLKEYQVARVTGDNYAGQTFQYDFEAEGITYEVSTRSASDLYEELEVKLNAGEVELLDEPRLLEQLTGLVMRGGKVTHTRGEHDDWANAAVGAVLALAPEPEAYMVNFRTGRRVGPLSFVPFGMRSGDPLTWPEEWR